MSQSATEPAGLDACRGLAELPSDGPKSSSACEGVLPYLIGRRVEGCDLFAMVLSLGLARHLLGGNPSASHIPCSMFFLPISATCEIADRLRAFAKEVEGGGGVIL